MQVSSPSLAAPAAPRRFEAIEAVLVRQLPFVKAWLRARMGAQLRIRETPEDLTQSVALEALVELGDFEWRGEAAFRSWLFVKAHRKLVDQARHVGAQQRSPQREQVMGEQVDELPSAFGRLSPSGEVQSLEEVRRIERAFDELHEDYREAIRLRRLCGMEYSAIAERMQRSEPAVRNLVHRGLSRLAMRLAVLRQGEKVRGDTGS